MGVDTLVRSAAAEMRSALKHMESQLDTASGIYIWSRFETDVEGVRIAAQKFEDALKLKESMVGGYRVQPESGDDQTRGGGGRRQVRPMAPARP